jgi:UDP-N-acetylglucosamine/UDP-N-acetylgalactosamine 4-epimerase
VTGVAGFIGTNLLEALLTLDQQVIGIDSLVAGTTANLDEVRSQVTDEQWSRFAFHRLDIRDGLAVRRAIDGAEVVVHLAALGGVPRSLEQPLEYHDVNVGGFLELIEAARCGGVHTTVYASSSSVYGDLQTLPQSEARVGTPLSPYAVTKRADELYASVFAGCYGMSLVGLRFFNVFGRRQRTDGPYAAVIPRWIMALAKNEPVVIHGNGTTSRDFCYVGNVVDAIQLAAVSRPQEAAIYNVACGNQTSLSELFVILADLIADRAGDPTIRRREPQFTDFRLGDIRHSCADLTATRAGLGYTPRWDVRAGLKETVDWYFSQANGFTA